MTDERGEPPVRKRFRIHDGSRTADDFRRLTKSITVALEAEIDRLRRGEGADDFDRARIKAAFDEAGFAGEYFGLDFAAPIGRFLATLEEVHTEDLPLYVKLFERYPSGLVEESAISIDQLLEELELDEED